MLVELTDRQSALKLLRIGDENKDIPEFTDAFVNRTTYARVLSVHDGDTVTLVMATESSLYKFRCRLSNIDTCEITSHDPPVRELAVRAKERLVAMCACGIVWVRLHGMDKYGRVLADIREDPGSPLGFGDVLVQEGLACVYNGHEKKTTADRLVTRNN